MPAIISLNPREAEIGKEKQKKKKKRRGGRKRRKGMNSNNKLTIAHMNIRGIKSKIRDLKAIADEQKFDIMVFTETKLKQKETRKIEGYREKKMNRNTEAGGVIIYVQDNLKTKIIKKNKICETLWLKVKGKESEIVIGAVQGFP